MNVCKKLLENITLRTYECRYRRLSYFVNKIRTLEWMKNDDSALQAEFKRGQFLVFYDKQPFLRRSKTSTKLSLAWVEHDRLKNVAINYGFTLGPDNTALIDTVPMQGQTNDPEEEWLPVLTLGIRSNKSGNMSDSKLAEDLGGGEFVDMRRALFLMDDPISGRLLAKAQTLLRWSATYKFCPKCASPLKLKPSKAYAKCTSCTQVYYPAVSPVAITLISDEKEEHLLLVRQPLHLKGMYTAVAGFCEVGETLEQTVQREIAEEVGVDVKDIQYACLSQPWPFPQHSLMCAFRATAESLQQPEVDKSELEDAGWFTRDEVKAAFENTMNDTTFQKGHENGRKFCYVPPFGALAHDLIKSWLFKK